MDILRKVNDIGHGPILLSDSPLLHDSKELPLKNEFYDVCDTIASSKTSPSHSLSSSDHSRSSTMSFDAVSCRAPNNAVAGGDAPFASADLGANRHSALRASDDRSPRRSPLLTLKSAFLASALPNYSPIVENASPDAFPRDDDACVAISPTGIEDRATQKRPSSGGASDSLAMFSLGGCVEPLSPGASSIGSTTSRSTTGGGGGAFFFSPGGKRSPMTASRDDKTSATGAAKFFRKVPGGVRNFLRKKKSWPTFHPGHVLNGVSCNQDEISAEQMLLINVSVNNVNNSGDSATTCCSVVASGACQPIANRIRNMTTQNSACQLGVGRRLLARLPSKEDPGPRRDLTVNAAEAVEFALYANNNNSNNAPLMENGTNVKNLAPFSNSLLFSYNLPPSGAKFKFVHEGQIQLCRLNHSRTVLGKLASSKLLRRWETHFLTLGDDEISSKTPVGAMESPVKYALMEDAHALPQWDSSVDKFCIRIFVPEGSLLLQTNHAYTRNQWLYSIQWRRNLYRYRRIVELSSGRPEVLLKETKCLVEQVKCCPLQGDNLSLKAVTLISRLIEQIFAGNLPKSMLDPVIMCIAPLLDTVCAVTEVSPWLCKYCSDHPRSRLIDEVLSEVAQQTLKKTMDFGKYHLARLFVQDYLLAVNSQNNGRERIRNFINNVHSSSSCCPHPRVLPNLVVISLAAIHSLYDPSVNNNSNDLETSAKLQCFCTVFDVLSEFEDWRAPLSILLQPIPFPDEALANWIFGAGFGPLLRRMGLDPRCDIHLSLLGVRETKDGWFHLVCPGGILCADDGELFSTMLKTLLHCCCRRKKFLQSLNDMLGPLQLLALRENEACMEALCYMLEYEVVEGEDLKLQMITALQSTSKGKLHYAKLCDRQIALRELQQKGGPRKLTLPSKSTDSDLAVLLSSGSFGNLEWLSLAFTNVTSACADYLIKLPSLRYLNLWSTQFGDSGLQLLSEHLPKLQVLNLCETPMTDKGLMSLSSLKSLRKLNLNSTQLSAKTFLVLKTELPFLQEVDVRYTEAWCADDIIT